MYSKPFLTPRLSTMSVKAQSQTSCLSLSSVLHLWTRSVLFTFNGGQALVSGGLSSSKCCWVPSSASRPLTLLPRSCPPLIGSLGVRRQHSDGEVLCIEMESWSQGRQHEILSGTPKKGYATRPPRQSSPALPGQHREAAVRAPGSTPNLGPLGMRIAHSHGAYHIFDIAYSDPPQNDLGPACFIMALRQGGTTLGKSVDRDMSASSFL